MTVVPEIASAFTKSMLFDFFQYDLITCCSCPESLVSGVKISQSKFLIRASLHHRLQFSNIKFLSYTSDTVLSCTYTRLLNLYGLARTFAVGIFVKDC